MTAKLFHDMPRGRLTEHSLNTGRRESRKPWLVVTSTSPCNRVHIDQHLEGALATWQSSNTMLVVAFCALTESIPLGAGIRINEMADLL